MVTRMEQIYYEVQIPKMNQSLELLVDEMKRSNQLKEKELELKEWELEIMEENISINQKMLEEK